MAVNPIIQELSDALEVDLADAPAAARRPERLDALRIPGNRRVDVAAHVIRDGVVLKKGILKDGRAEIDDTFLEQLVEAGNRPRNGVKSRYDHPSASGTSMGTFLGRMKNFRRDGDVVRADLHLDPTSAETPGGKDLRAYVEQLALSDPDAFGLSIVVSIAKRIYRKDDDGDLARDDEGNPLPPLWRIKKLWAVDVVDEPAGQDGMFSTGTPAGVAAAWLDRYLAQRGLQFAPRGASDSAATDGGQSASTEKLTMKKTKQASQDAPADAGTPPTAEQEAAENQAETPSEGQAAQPPAGQAPAPAGKPAGDPVGKHPLSAEERQRIASEALTRADEIRGAAARLGLGGDKRVEELVHNAALSTDAACRELLKLHSAANPPVVITQAAADKFRAAALGAALLKCGGAIAASLTKEELAAIGDLRHKRLDRMAEECLRRQGLTIPDTNEGVVRLALNSTSDFPYLLENVAKKAMMVAFQMQRATWREWCGTGSVSDFKEITLLRVSEADDLLLVPEGAEYKDSTLSEKRQRGRVYKYGRTFPITWEAIVNDDMNQLTDQPRRFGGAAGRLISDLVYGLLLSNAMGPLLDTGDRLFVDGTNWFDDGDVPGTPTSVLDLTNGPHAINWARQLMRKRVGLAGKDNLDIDMALLLVPPELEMYARILMNSTASTESEKNAGVVNPWQNAARIVVEPRLSRSGFATAVDAAAWYALADKMQHEVFRVLFLNGQEEPTLEEEVGFRTDGRVYKVRQVVGVMPVENYGIVKSKGAA